jgi:septal ring factor EnvC (AmiA/AmiB activator)
VAEQESVQKKVAETERRTRDAVSQVASRQEEVEMLRTKIAVTMKELRAAKDNEKNAIKIAIDHVEDKVAKVLQAWGNCLTT